MLKKKAETEQAISVGMGIGGDNSQPKLADKDNERLKASILKL